MCRTFFWPRHWGSNLDPDGTRTAMVSLPPNTKASSDLRPRYTVQHTNVRLRTQCCDMQANQQSPITAQSNLPRCITIGVWVRSEERRVGKEWRSLWERWLQPGR